MFRLLPLLFIPFLSLSQRVDPKHELLWEISGNGMKQPSYLFGSFHSNDKRLFELSDSTFRALRMSEVIVLETDIFSLFDSWDTRTSMIDLQFDNQGEPYVIDNYATETFYGDEDGMPQFLDAFFEQYCLNSGKKFFPLESVDFQLNLLADVEETDFGALNWDALYTDKEEMIDAYLKGDIYQLDEILRSSLSVYIDGYDRIITDRNFDMAARMDSLFQGDDRRFFCAIGVGHLAGAEGVINLLRKKGYRMRKVLATFADSPTVDRKEVFSQNSYEYDTLSVHAIFPGKPKELSGEDEEYDVKLIYRDFGQGNTYEVEIYPRTMEIGLRELAELFIASPAESPARQIELESGGEAWEGLADSYPEGNYWARVIMNEDSFVVIKAYGGNKFMNSNRPKRFFDRVWFE